MADIGADRLRALRETVAAFAGDSLVSRQEMLVILDAALDRGQAREELRAAAKMLNTHADKVPHALWALVSSMWQAEKTIYGHDAPPTDAEIAAHRGHWRCVVRRVPAMSRDALLGDAARLHREAVDAEGHDARWWALDTDDRPCPWPVALAEEIGRERVSLRVDDPSKDDTDEAHPAWWRGYNADKGELAQLADEAQAQARTTYKLQIVVPDELVEILDNHVARMSRLLPGAVISRSSIVREWLENAYPLMEKVLRDMETTRALPRRNPTSVTAVRRPGRPAPAATPKPAPKKRGR